MDKMTAKPDDNYVEKNDNPKESRSSSTLNKSVIPPVIPMEWTNLASKNSQKCEIKLPIDVMEISADPSETDLTIVGTAGGKITCMGKDMYKYCSPNLTHLVLRSHLIKKMEGLSEKIANGNEVAGLKKLEVLELYDNQIELLENLSPSNGKDNSKEDDEPGIPGKTLKVLDMSYNVLRKMEPVKLCPNLLELYLANNKLKEIKGIENLNKLRKLDLGANRIREMDSTQLSGLTSLEELWLGKNKIERIDGLQNLRNLRRLDVQSNRLTVVDNLNAQVDSLEELYLADNGIDDIGASHINGLKLEFTNLITLDLSKNRIKTCSHFAHLKNLEDLWLSGNKIDSFEAIKPLGALKQLEGIYLEYNPIYADFEYRKLVKSHIPSINQIDADLVQHDALKIDISTKQIFNTSGNTKGILIKKDDIKGLQKTAIDRAYAETLETSRIEKASGQISG